MWDVICYVKSIIIILLYYSKSHVKIIYMLSQCYLYNMFDNMYYNILDDTNDNINNNTYDNIYTQTSRLLFYIIYSNITNRSLFYFLLRNIFRKHEPPLNTRFEEVG